MLTIRGWPVGGGFWCQPCRKTCEDHSPSSCLPNPSCPGWRRTTPELLQSGPKRVVRPSCCKVVPNGWSKVVPNYSSGGTWTGKPPVARLNFAPQKLKPIPRAGCSSPDFETRAQSSNFKPQSLRPGLNFEFRAHCFKPEPKIGNHSRTTLSHESMVVHRSDVLKYIVDMQKQVR